MDKLYVGQDIPLDYKYAQYNNYYIDLYNTKNLYANNSYDFYRVYTSYNGFYYEHLYRTLGSYSSTIVLDNIVTTPDILYRNDAFEIISVVFIFLIAFKCLLNLITTMIRKGGLIRL